MIEIKSTRNHSLILTQDFTLPMQRPCFMVSAKYKSLIHSVLVGWRDKQFQVKRSNPNSLKPCDLEEEVVSICEGSHTEFMYEKGGPDGL